MNNIVKGVIMNNKYLLMYKEYLLNTRFRTNNRVQSSLSISCCDNCNGSCINSKYTLIHNSKK